MDKLPSDPVDSACTKPCMDGLQHLNAFVVVKADDGLRRRLYSERETESGDLDIIFSSSRFGNARKRLSKVVFG